jgi:hypothetical protein
MDKAIYRAVSRAKSALTQGGKTFVLVGDDKLLFYSAEHGLAPILGLLDTNPSLLSGAIAGDSIVGLAAAFLLILAGVKAVFAGVITDAASELLSANDVVVTWQETAPYLVDRELRSRDKLDELLKGETDPLKALSIIRTYVSEQDGSLTQNP